MTFRPYNPPALEEIGCHRTYCFFAPPGAMNDHLFLTKTLCFLPATAPPLEILKNSPEAEKPL